jgi:hypothetical protein
MEKTASRLALLTVCTMIVGIMFASCSALHTDKADNTPYPYRPPEQICRPHCYGLRGAVDIIGKTVTFPFLVVGMLLTMLAASGIDRKNEEQERRREYSTGVIPFENREEESDGLTYLGVLAVGLALSFPALPFWPGLCLFDQPSDVPATLCGDPNTCSHYIAYGSYSLKDNSVSANALSAKLSFRPLPTKGNKECETAYFTGQWSDLQLACDTNQLPSSGSYNGELEKDGTVSLYLVNQLSPAKE